MGNEKLRRVCAALTDALGVSKMCVSDVWTHSDGVWYFWIIDAISGVRMYIFVLMFNYYHKDVTTVTGICTA